MTDRLRAEQFLRDLADLMNDHGVELHAIGDLEFTDEIDCSTIVSFKGECHLYEADDMIEAIRDNRPKLIEIKK